jgi:two-component system probable response regulator PhcQ
VAKVVAAVSHSILIVDDEPAIVAALRRTLRGHGYNIIGVTDPREALAILDREKVDIVISDIDMPEMSGLDLVARIRETHPEIVRILLTGRGTLDGALRAINDGEVLRFLTKPWDDDELRTTIEHALARLEELRRAQIASAASTKRRALLEALEREHPGIGSVSRDASGAYVVDDRRIESVRHSVVGELAKLLD